jgi:hypothetical protein
VDVLVLHVADCPNVSLVHARLAVAGARAGLQLDVIDRLVATQAEAEALGFVGSPTILVDGADPFDGPADTPSMACRLYPVPHGHDGALSVESLVEVLSGR